MSRLARGSKYYVAEHILEECEVTIERVSQHYTDDMMGHMNKEMTIFLDGMYPKQVSQWTRTKMEQMVAKGYFCGGTVPFGYRKFDWLSMRLSIMSSQHTMAKGMP